MTKFNLPTITRPISLGDYAVEYADARFDVWVNPPRKVMKELYRIQLETYDLLRAVQSNPEGRQEAQLASESQVTTLGNDLVTWLSQLWSAGAVVERHMTVDEVSVLRDTLNDSDPRAWQWLVSNTIKVVEDYRDVSRKN